MRALPRPARFSQVPCRTMTVPPSWDGVPSARDWCSNPWTSRTARASVSPWRVTTRLRDAASRNPISRGMARSTRWSSSNATSEGSISPVTASRRKGRNSTPPWDGLSMGEVASRPTSSCLRTPRSTLPTTARRSFMATSVSLPLNIRTRTARHSHASPVWPTWRSTSRTRTCWRSSHSMPPAMVCSVATSCSRRAGYSSNASSSATSSTMP